VLSKNENMKITRKNRLNAIYLKDKTKDIVYCSANLNMSIEKYHPGIINQIENTNWVIHEELSFSGHDFYFLKCNLGSIIIFKY